MKYKQIITDVEYIANTLNALTANGKQIKYVHPVHRHSDSLVVIVYTEEIGSE